MKRCSGCKQEKEDSLFNKNRTKKSGLHDRCRECMRLKSRQYYKQNKAKHLVVVKEKKHAAKLRNQTYVLDYLCTHPCVDCGEKDPVLLEFDHRKDKLEIVTKLVHRPVGLPRLQRELAKCDVRCVSCHRKKTAKDQRWFKYLNRPVLDKNQGGPNSV